MRDKLLLALGPSDWGDHLITEVTKRIGDNFLVSTSDGDVVLRALTGDERPRLVIVGPMLTGIGGLEAIYQAQKEDGQAGEPGRQPILGLVSDTRSDPDLLALYRKRGVSVLIFHSHPIDKTIATICDAYHSHRRAHARFPCKLQTIIEIGEKRITGTMLNVSVGGCMVSVKKNQLDESLPIGLKLSVTLGPKAPISLVCSGELCEAWTKSKWTGDELALRIRFTSTEFDSVYAIEKLVKHASIVAETTSGLWGSTYSSRSRLNKRWRL